MSALRDVRDVVSELLETDSPEAILSALADALEAAYPELAVRLQQAAQWAAEN